MDLIDRRETERLINEFFAVPNEVGLGRHEEAYHQADNIWVAEQSLPVSSKSPVPLLVAGREAIVLDTDFVAWDQTTRGARKPRWSASSSKISSC